MTTLALARAIVRSARGGVSVAVVRWDGRFARDRRMCTCSAAGGECCSKATKVFVARPLSCEITERALRDRPPRFDSGQKRTRQAARPMRESSKLGAHDAQGGGERGREAGKRRLASPDSAVAGRRSGAWRAPDRGRPRRDVSRVATHVHLPALGRSPRTVTSEVASREMGARYRWGTTLVVAVALAAGGGGALYLMSVGDRDRDRGDASGAERRVERAARAAHLEIQRSCLEERVIERLGTHGDLRRADRRRWERCEGDGGLGCVLGHAVTRDRHARRPGGRRGP